MPTCSRPVVHVLQLLPCLPLVLCPTCRPPLTACQTHLAGPHCTRSAYAGTGIEVLFPVQAVVWAQTAGGASQAHDVCICAPTGSGKTLSYALPLLQALAGRAVPRLRALAVLPTRDLASQVGRFAEQGGLWSRLAFSPSQGALVCSLNARAAMAVCSCTAGTVGHAAAVVEQANAVPLPQVFSVLSTLCPALGLTACLACGKAGLAAEAELLAAGGIGERGSFVRADSFGASFGRHKPHRQLLMHSSRLWLPRRPRRMQLPLRCWVAPSLSMPPHPPAHPKQTSWWRPPAA